MKRYGLLIVGAVVLLAPILLGGCAPAAAEVGSEENPVKLMFVPSVDVAVIETAGETMASWITEQTGIHFDVSVPVSYAATIEAMCTAEGDTMAFIPGMGYVLANNQCGVEVALATVRYGPRFATAGRPTGPSLPCGATAALRRWRT
jgi:phosphonate transport system substrate-binding protein